MDGIGLHNEIRWFATMNFVMCDVVAFSKQFLTQSQYHFTHSIGLVLLFYLFSYQIDLVVYLYFFLSV